MQEIIGRYQGKKTAQGHELRVDGDQEQAVIWFLYWGEYQGVDAHHHVGIARVRRDGAGYRVGWLRGTETRPYDETDYAGADEMFAAIDDAAQARSAEVGP